MSARMADRIAGRLGGGAEGSMMKALRAKLPPPRRLVPLLAGLAVAVAGGAYVTFGAGASDVEVDVPALAAAAAPAATPASPPAPTAAPAAPAAPAVTPNDSTRPAASGAPAATPAADVRRPAPDTVVIEREVYGYAGGGRRDPFRPLIVTTVLRPFPSELRLVAVAYDPSGANSVAILRDVTSKAQHRVRAGQLIGRMRVVRIQPKAVVFAVEELGFSRRETLTLHDSLPPRQP